ncbi:MAG: Glycosyl hydrolase family 20, catalytic domain [Lentisphaerae bacterium ADurb.Bin082]|nr:MAG: Glycosyl hydrolase family 20, catalytic domain [Lentisphaerae bacterium ADurb.Bin082]
MTATTHRLFPRRFFLLSLGLLLALTANANLLLNGNFRSDANNDGVADQWRPDTSAGLEGEYAVTEEDGRSCQKLILRAPLKTMQIFRVSQDNIPARPGKHFLLTGAVKAEATARVYFYEFLQDGTYLTHAVTVSNKKQGWQDVNLLIKTTPQCRSFKLSLLAVDADKPVWFSDFSIVDLEAPPRQRVPQLAAAPPLTADWNAPEWRQAASADAFVLCGKELKSPAANTKARFALTGDTLHIIMQCEEPRLADVRTTPNGTWGDDTIEVFIKTPADGGLLQFGLTPAGAKLSNVTAGTTIGFHTDWHSRATTANVSAKPTVPPWDGIVTKQANAWTAQFAITLPKNAIPATRQLEVLLARSRKLKDFAEDSSWGWTSGEFFRHSNCFARLALASIPGAAPSGPVLEAQPPPLPGQMIVPTPQSFQPLADAPVLLKNPLRVYAGPNAAKARDAMAVIFRHHFDVDIAATDNQQQADVVLTIDPDLSWDGSKALATWQQDEGYLLQTGKVTTATARTHRGLVYALQSMAQLADVNAGALRIRPAKVTDWPDMAMRGWHSTGPGTRADVPAALTAIDVMAALKMNWFSIQFDNRFQYERRPGLSGANAPTKDDHRELAARIDLYGMDVIPMTQCMSHFNYFLKLPEFKHLAEVQEPDPKSRHQFWNYCPRHPEIHDLVFDMIEEHLECYPKAKWYHVGLDEITFEPIGVCERCRGASGGTLVAEEINRLHAFVTSKGKRMCIWGDQLLVEHNGGRKYRTAEALPEVPRDVVIFDWHYGETTEYPSVQFFKEHGFDVISSGWFFPDNVAPFIDETFRQGVLGYGGTTWTSIAQIRHRFHLMTAFVLAGDRCWKKSTAPLGDLPYRPIEVFRKLYDGASARRPARFRELPIADWGTMALTGGGPYAWMGQSPEHDASALPTGRGWFAGVPFTIPADGKPVIALASEKDDPDLVPDSAWQIPVNGKVAGLAFLQTCSVPEKFQRHMYDRTKINPTKPGTYIIHYADGATTAIPLDWGVNLASWNTQIGSSDAVIGWQGKTRGGAMLSVEVLTWWNPRPEAEVVAIDFLSSRSTVRPALLGLTAILE